MFQDCCKMSMILNPEEIIILPILLKNPLFFQHFILQHVQMISTFEH